MPMGPQLLGGKRRAGRCHTGHTCRSADIRLRAGYRAREVGNATHTPPVAASDPATYTSFQMSAVSREVTIRLALPEDISAIQNVARLAWSAAYEGIIPRNIQDHAIAHWYSHEALVTAVEAPESLFLLAERAKVVVGFVNLYELSSVAVHLARIYFLPLEQRKGLGTRLLHAALELMPDGIEMATVEVEEQNYPARQFYESCGFLPVAATVTNILGFRLPLIRYDKKIERGAA